MATETDLDASEDPLPDTSAQPLPGDSPRLPMLRLAIPLTIAALAAVCYGLLGVQQWQNLVSQSWDLGIFSQLARAYAELRPPIVPIKGDDVNLLGDHFHPLLVLLGPIWAFWPSGLALLWTQAVLFGLSAFPLTRLAIDRLGPVPGTVVGVVYAFSFGLQGAVHAQFHEIAFAVPLLAFSLTALLRGRLLPAILWAAPLVLVKEDLGLTVAVIGLILILRHRRQWHAGAALAFWGAGWFLLSTYIILPALNPEGRYDYTQNIGSLLAAFVPVEKWMTVGLLLLTAGLIGARSPLILAMLPTLAWRFTGTVPFYWEWSWHYDAVLMPIAIAALLDALGDRHTGRASSGRRLDLPRPRPWIRGVAVAACALPPLLLGSSMPVVSVFQPTEWSVTWRAEPARATMEAVPEDSVVASDITLMAYLVTDHDVQWTHGPNERVPECVLIDQYAFSWPEGPPADPVGWTAESFGEDYDLVLDDGGFQVMCTPEAG